MAARVGGGVALLASALLVLRPFLVPVLWAGILAYVTWPLYRWMRVRTRRPRVAAAFFTAAVALGAGIPVAWILVALASEASHLIGVVRQWLDAGAPLPAWIAAHAWLADPIEKLRAESVVQPTDMVQYATKYAAQVSGRLVDLAGGLASNVFKFAITVVTLYVFLLDGERLAGQARRLTTIVFPNAPDFLEHVGAVVRAVVFGLLGTALVQALVAGIGFALFGVPSPVALGALTFAGSFIPMGPTLVWGGAVVWLFVVAHPYAALGMAIYGIALISTIDNVLRPLLISGGATQIPFLLVFFGVLGGLSAFGMLGLFLGPVLLSITFALVAEFSERANAAT
ncbi:MAG TPA: AI-2E family transporter [Myxococcota bacterium]|nr:AI-2E family transporter [Myxococcota bacterium]